MGDTLYRHNLAWGAPRKYADKQMDPELAALSYGARYADVYEAIRAVARTANWYPEQTRVLAAMVRARDAAAIRRWDVGHLGEGEGADEWADEVDAALEALADLIEDEEEEE